MQVAVTSRVVGQSEITQRLETLAGQLAVALALPAGIPRGEPLVSIRCAVNSLSGYVPTRV